MRQIQRISSHYDVILFSKKRTETEHHFVETRFVLSHVSLRLTTTTTTTTTTTINILLGGVFQSYIPNFITVHSCQNKIFRILWLRTFRIYIHFANKIFCLEVYSEDLGQNSSFFRIKVNKIHMLPMRNLGFLLDQHISLQKNSFYCYLYGTAYKF